MANATDAAVRRKEQHMRKFLFVVAAGMVVGFAAERALEAASFGNLVIETPSGARVRAPNPTTTQVWIADTTAPLGGAFKTMSGDATLAATGALTLGTVSVGKGGTGATTLTDHGVLVGSGTGAITPLSVCTNGQLIVGASAADPACQTMSGDATLAANGALTLATVGVTKGGTGLTTMTDHGFLLGSGTGAVTPMAVCTDGQLAVGQSTADPACQTVGGDATLAANGTLTLATVTVAKGGTGATTLTDHGFLLGSGTGAVTPLAVCTDGQIPVGATGADPACQSMSGDATLSSAGALTLATVPVTRGGTGATTLPACTTNQALRYDGTTWTALGTVASVTGTAPVTSSGGATPAISMAAASASVNGYLSSSDWTAFDAKQAAGAYLTECTADAPITGAGTSGSHLQMAAASSSVNGYLSSSDWTAFDAKQAAGAYLTAVVADAPLSGSGTSGSHLLMSVATADANGYLSSSDWTAFNGKQAAGSYAASGANSDITSLSALSTALSVAQGGTGATTVPACTTNQALRYDGTTWSALGTVASVSGTAPVASSGGATPAISLPVATADADGYLSSTNWSAFNGKQALLGDCATIDSATDLDTALTAIGQIKTCIETTWGK